MDIVLNNYDLVKYILQFLNYKYVSSVDLVNKLFHEVSMQLYPIKWKKQIVEPFHTIIIPMIKNYYESIRHDDIHLFFMMIMHSLKDFWPILVKDFETMEMVFLLFVHHDERYIEYQDYPKDYNILKKKFASLFYIEYPEKYTVYQLKQFAKYKNIKQYYSKNRSQLIKCLTRPTNEIYIDPF